MGDVHGTGLRALVPNGLGSSIRLTQSSYRQAVGVTVSKLQNGSSDQDMADAWGVSKSTVETARNRKHDLAGMSMLKLGERFGPSALDTIACLIGAKVVARDAVTVDVASIPCEVAKVVPLLIELFGDGECSDTDVRKLDAAGAIDCLGRAADMLRHRRDQLRLQTASS